MTEPSSSSTTDDAGKHALPLLDDGVGLTLARVPLGRIVSVALGSAVSVALGTDDVATGSAVALAAATAVGDTVVVCRVAELLNPVAAVVALGLVGAVAVALAAAPPGTPATGTGTLVAFGPRVAAGCAAAGVVVALAAAEAPPPPAAAAATTVVGAGAVETGTRAVPFVDDAAADVVALAPAAAPAAAPAITVFGAAAVETGRGAVPFVGGAAAGVVALAEAVAAPGITVVGEGAVEAGTGAVPFVGGAGVGAEASPALIQKLPHIPAPGVRRGPQTRLESQHGT
jgi:hypothetical protein